MILLRRATLDDLPALRRWDEQPHVSRNAGTDGPFEWERELQLDVDWQEILIIETGDRAIGVLVILEPARDAERYWGDIGPGVRAIDIWIGEEDCLGRGYGTAAMHQAIARCFADPGCHAILVDPLAANDRAHRFYARLGFRAIERRVFGGDDCMVYRLERDLWRSGLT